MKKIDFMYQKEVFSFRNKKFVIGAILLVVALILFGIFTSDLMLMLEILVVICVGYGLIAIRTYNVSKEYMDFKKKGKRCEGLIKGISVDENYNYDSEDFETYDNVHLVVEYTNPFTNCLARFVTAPIHGNPYSHLKSLKVVVYVLEDGKAYATGFKKIKKEKDAIKYHDKNLKELIKE